MARQIDTKDTLEFIAELGDRFPDMTDTEVLDAADEYEGRVAGTTNPRSPIGLVIIAAYLGGMRNASAFSTAAFGVDFTT